MSNRCLLLGGVLLTGAATFGASRGAAFLPQMPVELVGGVPAAQDETAPWGYLFHVPTRHVYPLRGSPVALGRLAKSDVLLSDPRVSRRHAEIRREAGAVFLVDLGSTNGTRLNGQGLASGEPARLGPGDVLELAADELLYHEDKAALGADALAHVLLGQIVHLKVPVAEDRTTRVLSAVKSITASSRAAVDVASGGVQMDFGEAGESDGAFKVSEAAIVGEVVARDGAVSLSLWGWDRSGAMVSRRAAFSKLKHGELRLEPSAGSESERARLFEEGWRENGIGFVSPMLSFVLELVPESQAGTLPQEFARELVEQPLPAAARDAATILAFRCRRERSDPELPALVAKARARAVRLTAAERRASLSDKERSELEALLVDGREWLKKAAERGAKEKALSSVEVEFASAEKVLGGKL